MVAPLSGGGESLSEERLETLAEKIAEIAIDAAGREAQAIELEEMEGTPAPLHSCRDEAAGAILPILRAFAREILQAENVRANILADDYNRVLATYVRREELLASQESEKRLAEALDQAWNDLHSEFCGRDRHHDVCARAETALSAYRATHGQG